MRISARKTRAMLRHAPYVAYVAVPKSRRIRTRVHLPNVADLRPRSSTSQRAARQAYHGHQLIRKDSHHPLHQTIPVLPSPQTYAPRVRLPNLNTLGAQTWPMDTTITTDPQSLPHEACMNDRSPTDMEIRRLHPYANPDSLPQALVHQPHTRHEQVDGEYNVSSLPVVSGGLSHVAGPNHKQGYYPTQGTVSPRHHPLPPSGALTPSASPHDALPPKMAPWQHTPSSPTFRLLSLEEAQAKKSKQRSAAMGTSSPTSSSHYIRDGPSAATLHRNGSSLTRYRRRQLMSKTVQNSLRPT
jgi:hypothetical protein